MAEDKITEILAKHKAQKESGEQPAEEDKFFSILVGDGREENFLELQFRDGLRLCLSYGDLQWFQFEPEESSIELEFGSTLVSIKGRGLLPRLFNGLRQKRVAWVKEADSELQDHDANATFIEEISMVAANEFTGEEEATPQ